MPKYQEHDDGTRVYPKRGTPPVPPPGYAQAPGDPFKLIPILPECEHRFTGEHTMPCGKKLLVQACRKGFEMSQAKCLNCIETKRRDQA